MTTADEVIVAGHALTTALRGLLRQADFMDFPVLGRLPLRLGTALRAFDLAFPVGTSRADFPSILRELNEATAKAGTITATLDEVNAFLREAFEAIDRLDLAVAQRIVPA